MVPLISSVFAQLKKGQYIRVKMISLVSPKKCEALLCRHQNRAYVFVNHRRPWEEVKVVEFSVKQK